MKILFNIGISLLIIFSFGCNGTKGISQSNNASWVHAAHNFNVIPKKIAFGSCSKFENGTAVWPYVSRENPDLWIWLGDIVYADSDDKEEIVFHYDRLKTAAPYLKMIKKTPILGTWDDHDYGLNDGGKEFNAKDLSKTALFDFLEISEDNPARQREGVYQSYTYGERNQMKIVLLDARYFRDQMVKDPDPNNRYYQNMSGTMLGETQWTWLEKQLSDKKTKTLILGSGIQVLSEEHGYEKWANFPHERRRLLEMLGDSPIENIFIISGDRHIAEVSKTTVNDKELVEITSSGLTHTWSSDSGGEPNKYRIGQLIIDKNFALMEFETNAMHVKIINDRGETKSTYTFNLN